MPTKKTKTRTKSTKKVVKRSTRKCNESTGLDNFLADLTAHKMTVAVLIISIFGLGLLFSVVLGVSASGL